jgi:quinoprotein dehydrogenase-associated probable ABC transporter substrate-binding protein
VNRRRIVAALCVTLGAGPVLAEPPDSVLRVCSDPQNLPYSNRAGEGFENRIAEELARDLGRTRVEYTWFPQRLGFVRNTLRKKDETTGQFACDVIIGVPEGYELTATTRPYMRSTYSLVHAGREDLDGLRTADDLLKLPIQELHSLRIGVFARSPGADWLLRNQLLDHAIIFPAQSGDPSVNPASVIGHELATGNIDVAIVWGPIAGYLAREHATSTPWRVVPFSSDPQIRFDFPIAMGVRFGENEWKATLDQWIAGHEDKIQSILREFGVPLLDQAEKPP